MGSDPQDEIVIRSEYSPSRGPGSKAAINLRPPIGFYIRAFCDSDQIPAPQEALDWLNQQGVYLWLESSDQTMCDGMAARIDIPLRSVFGKIMKADVSERVLLVAPRNSNRFEPAEIPISDRTEAYLDGEPIAMNKLSVGWDILVTRPHAVALRVDVLAGPQRKPKAMKTLPGRVVNVDCEKSTLTVRVSTGDDEQPYKTLVLSSEKVQVILNGEEAGISDLKDDQEIQLTPSRGSVRIELPGQGQVDGPPLRTMQARVIEADATLKTVTVTAKDEEGQARRLLVALATNAGVFLDGKPASLGKLQPRQDIFMLAGIGKTRPIWKHAMIRWNKREAGMLLECNRGDGTEDGLVAQEVQWFIRHLRGSWLSSRNRRLIRQLEGTKVIVACRMEQHGLLGGVLRARMKLMEFFANRCQGIVQVDGEGFYQDGGLAADLADRVAT